MRKIQEVQRDALGISDYKLALILDDVSYNTDQINKDFLHYLDATNSWKKPLIRLDDNHYFCLDGRMSGYAFYEVMYQILFDVYGGMFSRKQGEKLENMVYQMFREKQFPYLSGRYKACSNLPERDCDMILSGKKAVMFLEIKKCPLPQEYEQADDVMVLQALGNGMLYAQEQILWHKVMLKENGVLELYDKEGNHIVDFSPKDKRILTTSICMPEYDFLTDRVITKSFLESTLLVNYHAVDVNREHLLKKLNIKVSNIQNAANRLFDGKKFDVKEIFFDAQFRSLQQIWTMLKFCNNVEEFLDLCETQLFMITGSGDVYAEILNAVSMRDINGTV